MKRSGALKRGILVGSGLMVLAGLLVGGVLLILFPGLRVLLRAKLGDTEAMLKMGNVTQELHWIEDACKGGNSRGCWAVWNVYQGHNDFKAFEALQHGAALELKQRKSYECLLELTRVHEYGLLGQPRNPSEAAKIRKQCSEILQELRAKGMIP